MKIAMVGLGRMGANMVRRLLRNGHECIVHDISADTVAALVDEGAQAATHGCR
jgi:6-phosphogluconate dehydrogenase